LIKHGKPVLNALYSQLRPHLMAKFAGYGLAKPYEKAEDVFASIAKIWGGDEGYNPIDHTDGTYAL